MIAKITKQNHNIINNNTSFSENANSYDTDITYRDFKTIDIPHIPPLPGKLEEGSQGRWLHVKVSNSGNGHGISTWTRKFVQLRGMYMLLFNAPGTEKPTAIMALAACKLLLPQNNSKNYESKPAAITEVGWEFKLFRFDTRK